MRLSNDRDQALVRSAVSDAAASLLAFLPSLGTREVFAFGEGVALPTRLKFRELPAHLRPKGEMIAEGSGAGSVDSPEFIANVIERWRGATMSHKGRPDEPELAAGELS
jgi:DNA helicase HerA-like ATPase